MILQFVLISKFFQLPNIGTSIGPSIISLSEMGSHEQTRRDVTLALFKHLESSIGLSSAFIQCALQCSCHLSIHTHSRLPCRFLAWPIRRSFGFSVFLSDTCVEEEGHQGGIELPTLLIRSWPVFLSKLLFSVGILWADCSVFWLNMFTFDNS